VKDVDEMASSMIIETESGTFTGKHNSHDGYYAGDFSDLPRLTQNQLAALITPCRVPAVPQPHH
jgi:hypothetical protein